MVLNARARMLIVDGTKDIDAWCETLLYCMVEGIRWGFEETF